MVLMVVDRRQTKWAHQARVTAVVIKRTQTLSTTVLRRVPTYVRLTRLIVIRQPMVWVDRRVVVVTTQNVCGPVHCARV